ncbi:MAG TPA: hypothetical protein VLC09_02815, partial [Polyangiaceae bacterium]|nr:hypothetical protein [Polyangiaceae bacterium]
MPTRAAPTHSVPTQTAPRFEVAEPSGKRHQLPVGELAKAWSAGQFEAGTLVKSPGSANWVPPYDLPELAGVAAPNLAATATAGRTTQLTFSDETVSLGVDESAALSRQAFAAQRALEGAPAARAVPSVPEDSGFEDEEVATVVRSLDQLNQLRELAQAPSKQPTLKPPSGVAVPPEALPSRPSPLPPRPPGPAPGVGGATPAAAAEAPLQRAIPKRHNPTLLGVPAPAIHGASPAPAAFVPGAAAPTA